VESEELMELQEIWRRGGRKEEAIVEKQQQNFGYVGPQQRAICTAVIALVENSITRNSYEDSFVHLYVRE
jgi:formaldehyde-activating enzyme involved in methanogenesis